MKNIVLIDDDIYIREALKSVLHIASKNFNQNFKLYSSSNGAEGLGLVYIANPDIIIVDLTLPKYSGREVLDFVILHEKFKKSKIIVLGESSKDNHELLHKSVLDIVFLNKSKPDFLQNFLNGLTGVKFNSSYSTFKKARLLIAKKTIRWGNVSDRLMRKITGSKLAKKIALYPLWLSVQFIASFYLSLLYLFVSRVNDDNLEQLKLDKSNLRIKTYPTIATVLAGVFILVFQVGLFTAGGIVVLNTKIESVFALMQNNKTYELRAGKEDEYIYNSEEVEFSIEGVKLVQKLAQLDQPIDEQLTTLETEVPTLEAPTQESLTEEQPVSLPTVLGESTEIAQQSDHQSQNHSSIITRQSTSYSDLSQIIEKSSINDEESSATKTPVSSDISITYQLSPNGNDWYYFEESESWNFTTNEWQSSNSIQEVNANLDKYQEEIDGGELFLKVFLNSNSGIESPTLSEIIVEKDSNLISSIEEPEDGNQDPEIIVKTVINLSEMEPVIFNASFVNGEKVILGKLLSKDKKLTAISYELSSEDISNYQVNIYFSDAEVATKNSLIGTTNLYINQRNELEFMLRTASAPGGYVTAEVSLPIPSSEIEGSSELVEGSGAIATSLAKPVENSTFTVDSTGDDADAVSNGLCASAGGACTLRAAIAEANFVAGLDNIYFNIPTSDSGYRDYDTPDTASSGDSTGGDDYWTIRPVTALPTITEGVVIDGATQEANQGDLNVNAPDIELQRNTVTVIDGFTISSNGSSINKLTINSFRYGVLINNIDGFVLTRSFLGLDSKGLSAKANTNAVSSSGTNVYIGQDTSTRNIISNGAVVFSCGTGTTKTVFVRGNIMGLNVNEEPVGSGQIIAITGQCDAEVGGDSVSHRNIISGSTSQGVVTGPAVEGQVIKVFYNFFGTDSTGTLNRQNVSQDIQLGGGHSVLGGQSFIGGPGKGNLFRFGGTVSGDGIRVVGERDLIISYNSFGDKGRGGIWLGNAPHSINNYRDVEIYNNFLGETNSDPYFGLALGPLNNTSGAIINWGSSSIIKGNRIIGNAQFGIHNYVRPLTDALRTNTTDDMLPSPVIGGQNIFSGSLCNGLEKNCISSNEWGGISTWDSTPENEATLWDDNDFTGGNGSLGSNNIEQNWYGLFELASSNYRRTDLSGTVLNFPSGTRVRTAINPNNTLTSATAINVTCLNTSGVGCPASGHTNGTSDSTYVIVPSGMTSNILNDFRNWFVITEYIVDGSGYKVDYGTFKFDQPHFASNIFTFDGDSTNNIINTGSSRTLNAQNYTDRGEPWTDKPGATRNIATGDLGRFQIMEVEYVDANPILQQDGSYIITVDSTEAIVTATGTTYFDDGGSPASGGMSKLATATLANGKSSFREAVNVANNFPQPLTINFNIPESDSGFINPDGSRAIPSEPAGTYPTTPLGYWTIEDYSFTPYLTINKNEALKIDGYTVGTTKNTASIGQSFNAQLRIQLNVYWLGVDKANGLEISGLNLTGHDNSIRISSGVNSNIWIHGSYLGTHIDGTNLTVSDNTNAGGIRATAQVNGLTIGTNGDGIDDRNEFNIIGGANQAVSGLITIYSTGSGTRDVRLSGNYMFTDKTGNICSPFNGDRAVFESGVAPNIQNAIVGSNLDGVADSDESNVMGCINTNYRAYIRAFNLSNSIIAGNYIGISPSGSDLRDGGVGAEKAIEIIGSENLQISNNTIKSYDVSNLGTIRVSDNSTGLNFKENRIIGGTVAFGGIPLRAVVERNTFEGYTDLGAFIGSTGAMVTFKQNKFLGATSARKMLHLGDFATGNLSPATNDSGDIDTGPNNLMNYPVITSIQYIGAGQYQINGTLDNSVVGESPFGIEICLSENHSSEHGGCIESLGYFENQSNTFSLPITILGDDGTQNRSFTALATNALGSTSEFGKNVSTTDPEYSILNYPIQLVSPKRGVRLDDQTPMLDWNAGLSILNNTDPELNHYELYIDGVFYTALSSNTTQYQITNPLNLGEHTWQIIGFRSGTKQSGISTTESFTVQVPVITFEALSPIDTTIDTKKPFFDWIDARTSDTFSAIIYDLYIDDKLTIKDLTASEFQMEEELAEGAHSWYVVVYGLNNGVKEEIKRTEMKVFTIHIAKEIVGPISYPTEQGGTKSEPDGKISKILVISAISSTIISLLVILFIAARRKHEFKINPKY